MIALYLRMTWTLMIQFDMNNRCISSSGIVDECSGSEADGKRGNLHQMNHNEQVSTRPAGT